MCGFLPWKAAAVKRELRQQFLALYMFPLRSLHMPGNAHPKTQRMTVTSLSDSDQDLTQQFWLYSPKPLSPLVCIDMDHQMCARALNLGLAMAEQALGSTWAPANHRNGGSGVHPGRSQTPKLIHQQPTAAAAQRTPGERCSRFRWWARAVRPQPGPCQP